MILEAFHHDEQFSFDCIIIYVRSFDSNNEVISPFLNCLEPKLIKILIRILFSHPKDVLRQIIQDLIFTYHHHTDNLGFLLIISESDGKSFLMD